MVDLIIEIEVTHASRIVVEIALISSIDEVHASETIFPIARTILTEEELA